jgi:hypothetical protein
MPAKSPQFYFDFESNLRVLAVDEYARIIRNLFVDRIAKTIPSDSKKEVIGFLLDTATIEDQGKGGNVAYDDMSIVEYDVTNLDAGKGLQIRKQQFEDLDGRGVQIGTKWVRNITAQAAYWKQKKVMQLIKDAASSGKVIAYDKKNFFSSSETIGGAVTNAHPYDPNDTSKGGFPNWFTGGASGSRGYPGAVPIDTTNASSDEDAFKNMILALAYVAGAIKMPNGVDPRFLLPTEITIVHPPALTGRVSTLTDAKFIAKAASSGGGAADVAWFSKRYGFGTPIEAPELSEANGGSDTDYYLVLTELAGGDQLGAFLHLLREAFGIQFYSGSGSADGIDAVLMRSQMLEWLTHGRYAVAPGHPYLAFKCSGT